MVDSNVETRKCSKCGEIKLISEFNRGGQRWCRDCSRSYITEWHKRNPVPRKYPKQPIGTGTKICTYCKTEKSIDQFGKNTNTCKLCKSVMDHKYYLNNKGKIINYIKQWEKDNPDRKKHYSHKRYKNNPDKVKAINKRWRDNHPDRMQASRDNWAKEHPDALAERSLRYRAHKAEAPGRGITEKQIRKIKEEYFYRCAYCGKKKKLTIDHVVPLNKGGRHDIDNVVPACKSCNSSKSDINLLYWMYSKAVEV